MPIKNIGDIGGPRWMGNLPDEVRKKPIYSIHVPGSHDSAAFKIDFKKRISSKFFLKLANLIARVIPFVRKFFSDWTVTEGQPIKSQLESGIRYLDLRVSLDRKSGKWYLSHSFACAPLDEAIADIKKFMSDNPREILFVDITSDFINQDGKTTEELKDLFQNLSREECLGNLTRVPPENDDSSSIPSLQDMQDDKKGRIILYCKKACFSKGNRNLRLWPRHINAATPNTPDPEKAKNILKQKIDELPYIKGRSNKIQAAFITVTGDFSAISADFFKRLFIPYIYKKKSLQELTKELDADKFIKDNKNEFRGKVGLIVTDFPNKKFIEEVVKLNLSFAP